MSKIIESEVKKFTGKVHLYDPMTMPMVLALEEALIESGEFFDETVTKGKEGDVTVRTLKTGIMWGKADANYLKPLLLCVEKWELENFPKDVTADTFPFTPRVAIRTLIDFVMAEIMQIYIGEIEIPNE